MKKFNEIIKVEEIVLNLERKADEAFYFETQKTIEPWKFAWDEVKQIIKDTRDEDILYKDICELLFFKFIPVQATKREPGEEVRLFTENDIDKIRVFLEVRGILRDVIDWEEVYGHARYFSLIEEGINYYAEHRERYEDIAEFIYEFVYGDDVDEQELEDSQKSFLDLAMTCYAFIDMFWHGWFNIEDYNVCSHGLAMYMRNESKDVRLLIEKKLIYAKKKYQNAKAWVFWELSDEKREKAWLLKKAMEESEEIRIWCEFVYTFDDASRYLGRALLPKLPALGKDIGRDLTEIGLDDVYNAANYQVLSSFNHTA